MAVVRVDRDEGRTGEERGQVLGGGEVQTNSIEAFWLHVKRPMSGTYVSVSKKWLQTYLWEFEFRQYLRKRPDLMLDLLLQAFPRPSR
ncbi:MAG: transposase [Pseudomonadota bacterium]